MSILEEVFSLSKEEQLALLNDLEQKASASSPIALPKEVIETFELPPEVDIEKELATIKEIVLAEVQAITINAPKGDKGDKGDKGAVGPQGPRGIDGVAGKDGKPGVDGKDGKDGISVTDARVDFDGSLVITLSDGKEINAGDVIPNDKKELVIQSLKNGALSLIELGIEDFLSSPTPIGNVTPNTGAFTSVTTPSVTATTNNLTLNAISTGAVKFSTAGGLQMQVADIASASRYIQVKGSSSGSPEIGVPTAGTLVLYGGNTSGIAFYSNAYAQQQFGITHTASAVNYLQITGGVTSGGPALSVQGSDTNAELKYLTKGIFNHSFQNGSGAINFTIDQTAGTSVVNRNATAGSLAGFATRFYAAGSDTNISMAFQPKGTGAINLAAGSRGVNISNGGTVTAITRTNTGTGYTSIPSIAVSAPTTAGGVTATVTPNMFLATYSIANGGTGYTVGNVLTVVGGTQSSPIQFTVSSVSSGVITAVTITSFGFYSALPTSPVSVTGGTGSSATFNLLTWGVSGFTITNAGSGYIEQPTVTFSGGGGSGAAAYATVGSGTIVRTLASPLSIYTPGGEAFRVSDGGATSAAYWNVFGGSVTSILRGIGSTSAIVETGSAVPIQFRTNGTTSGVEQFRVSHTASAVNYVQVTGSATGGIPAITAQGSDANTPLSLWSKNTGSIFFYTSGGSAQFEITATASAVNRIQATGAIAGASPRLTSAGSDTNINLTLTPKGTGRVQFGTYTATVSTIAGYIEILDSGGTVRRLAVVS